MRKLSLIILGLSLIGMLHAQSIAGDWHGTLEFSGIKIRLIFHIQAVENGYTATMDSPDQGATGIPVQTVDLQGDQLTIRLPNLGVNYQAKVLPGGNSIKGDFQQGAANIPFELSREAQEKQVLNRPQEPHPPFPYREEEVRYENTRAKDVTLAGTLALPPGEGPFAAVILISGSGPHDRNEEMLAHKPFLVIADYFTRAGLAVLRFDDRGVRQSTGDFATATTADFATDVQAGIDFLKTRKEIAPQKIGLAGHSEGGLIGPMVAADNPDVAFLVLMAGPGVNGEKVLLLQEELMARAEGSSEEDIQTSQKISQKVFQDLRNSTDLAETKKQLIEYVKTELDKLSAENKEKIGDLDKLAEQQINSISSPWFRYFLSYEPEENLRRVKCPVLAINGGKDLQVDADQNLPAIEKALKKGGNTRFKTQVLPGLNHLFQHSATGKLSEYGQLEETFAPEALALMAEWIKEQI